MPATCPHSDVSSSHQLLWRPTGMSACRNGCGFAATVPLALWPTAPPFTQVLTVSSKYVVENQTGWPIEVKQRATPDASDASPTRCHKGSIPCQLA